MVNLYSTFFWLLISLGVSNTAFSQKVDVDLLNQIIAELIGEQDIPEIPVFTSSKQVCDSPYMTCNKKGQLIGLDFQFANLNGRIPESISSLPNLEYINLEYNYLSGSIPVGLAKLEKLEELSFHGNFLTGPIPADLIQISTAVDIDLSQNVIETSDDKLIRGLKIVDQVNLEGCRSPDSIYISNDKNLRFGNEEIMPVLDSVEIESMKEIDKNNSTEVDDALFKVVESMPRFPGCEDLDLLEEEKHKCAQEKMLQFIYRNLKYPAIDREMGMEGMVVCQFVILSDGSIGDVKLIRNPGGRLGNSGMWIINRMNYICEKWVPGMQNGMPVKVLYTLPLKFKLQ